MENIEENIYLCPSLMCAKFDNLENEVKRLQDSGVDIFHIDIMDGNFVPNFGMGVQDIVSIRKNTNKLIDVHLMINNPIKHIELFKNLGVNIIYIHPEAGGLTASTLLHIKESGLIPGLAINPETSVEVIKPLLNLVDNLLVMTVNPGFSGQRYLEFVDEKIEQLVHLKGKYNFKIFVDGAISFERYNNLRQMGVEGFILGTSVLFNKRETYREIIQKLRNV